MKFTSIIAFGILGVTTSYSQEWMEFQEPESSQEDSTPIEGGLIIQEPSQLKSFIKGLSRENLKVPGYEILIFFDNDRDKAYAAMKKFRELYPNHKCYIKYESSKFKVMVGPYFDELKAEYFRKEIKGVYPTALVVRSDVSIKP